MNRTTVKRALRGSSIVEFALVMPLLFILIANVVNFGAFFFAWVTVASAARAGSQYLIRAGAPAMGSIAPTAPTAAQVATNVVTPDVSSLLNRASLAVRVCTRNPSNAADTAGPPAVPLCFTPTGTFATTPSNPARDSSAEALNYVMVWVDVAYTYQPVIPMGLRFAGLGLNLTLPSNLVIHRQVVMRSIQ